MDSPASKPGASRREVIGWGAGAAAFLAAGGWLSRLLDRAGQNDAPAEVFKKDAPKEAVWKAWQQRGWAKEASHYLSLGRNVQCKICPNNCLLEPGDRSHCRNKVNIDGKLYTLAYANPCTFHIDPIEKKPLFHFLPGSRTFSLATSGCVFRCLNCQNWEISQKKPEETKDPTGPELRLRPPLPEVISLAEMNRLSLFPDDLAAVAAALKCPSISYTYSEPTAYFEYALDSCQAARRQKLRNVLVTCGSIEERALRDIGRWVDAAHVDLKGFDEETYRKLNSGRLQPILNTLKLLKAMGIWFEIINLVVPSYTDNLDQIKRMSGWIVDHLGPDQPIHFSRFAPQHKLTNLPPTPLATLEKARQAARAAGLRYVYLGNVREIPDAETTFCPGCGRAIIQREGYAISSFLLENGACRLCQAKIAGVWS